MTSKDVPANKAPKARIRAGVSALLCSIGLIVWSIAAVYFAASAPSGADWIGVVATILFFASWVVIPVLILATLILAMIALILNRVIGKIFGALAIVLPVAVIVFFLAQLGLFAGTYT
jgi:hypothetical protein